MFILQKLRSDVSFVTFGIGTFFKTFKEQQIVLVDNDVP